jgi:anti-sigma regulatory factor (Ser/Thr protein kinase)
MHGLGRQRFDADSGAPRAARQWVRGLVEDAVPAHALDDVLVMVSELATNAVRHGGGGFDVVVATTDEGELRIEVLDASPAIPQAQWVPAGATSGRGLAIVDALSESWGVTALEGGGKAVWFEVLTPAR